MSTHRKSSSHRLSSAIVTAAISVLLVGAGASCVPKPVPKPVPTIEIDSFAQGVWGDPPNLSGRVLNVPHPQQFWVVINGGMPIHPAANGRFFAAWPAFANHLPFHTIVAELQDPGFLTLDRDVRVAHHLTDFNAVPGPKDEPVAGGIRARLAPRGYDELATLVGDSITEIKLPEPDPDVQGPLATLLEHVGHCIPNVGVAVALASLNIAIPAAALTFCFEGVSQEIDDIALDGDATLTLEPQDPVGPAGDGVVQAEAVLSDLHATGTVSFEFAFLGLIPFHLDCELDITVDEATVDAGFELDPESSDPHLVDVTQRGVGVGFSNFETDFGGLCGPVTDVLNAFGFQLGENAAVNAIVEKLENVPDDDDDPFLAAEIEKAVEELAITSRLQTAFQAAPFHNEIPIPLLADAPIDQLSTDADGTEARFDVLIEVDPDAVDDTVQSEFLFPQPIHKVYPPVTPVQGVPYELAASIAVGSINQALRSAFEAGVFTQTLSTIDYSALGFDLLDGSTPDPNDVLEGPQPITAFLLAVLFIQDFGALDPNLELEFRLKPTLAPVVTLPDPQPPLRNDPIEVSVGGLEIEVAEPNDGKVWLTMAAGFTAGIDIRPGRALGKVSTHIDWPFAPPVLQSLHSTQQALGRWPDDNQSTCLLWLLFHNFVLPTIEKELVAIQIPALVLPGTDTVYQPDLIEREIINTDNTINFFLNFDPAPAGVPGLGTTPLVPAPATVCPVTTVTVP